MSADYATTDRIAALPSLAVAAGATVVYNTGRPIRIKRVTLVMSTAQTTAAVTATFGVRNRDGTSSTALGTFIIPVSPINAVLDAEIAGVKAAPVVNSGENSQVASVTTGRVSGYQTNLPGEIKLNPGQQFFITTAAAGAAGVADPYIEYQDEGSQPLRYNPTVLAVTLN